jgi:L,D-transpeptidase ErfK/SrfK
MALAVLAGCVFLPSESQRLPSEPETAPLAPDPSAPRLSALDASHAELASPDQDVIGGLQVLFTRQENTFSAIAREYDVGYYELGAANPGVDRWLPGDGTPVYLPTQWVLPDAPRDGIVVNLATMRLFYFTREPSSDGEELHVTTHPIGIGREGWETPIGSAEVTQKARDPVWYVPASVRAEHAAGGDPLPRIVEPGPDNPLGRFALGLSMPGYLIHGTNKPAGVGMRVSHGCIRLYPEDIKALFESVPKGTPVHIVNQPVLAGWRDGRLYLEVHPPLSEDQRDIAALANEALTAALTRAGAPTEVLDEQTIDSALEARRGLPAPVLRSGASFEQHLAEARVVENTVPLPKTEASAQAE